MSRKHYLSKLDKDLEDLRSLRRDIDHVLFDIECGRPEPIYAVDFSEIYAYTRPKSSGHASDKDFRLFRHSEDENDVFLQLHALRVLFEDPEKKRYLLPAYAVELEEYAERLQSEQIGNAIDQLVELHSSLEDMRTELKRKKHRAFIESVVREYESGGVRDQTREQLVELVADMGPVITFTFGRYSRSDLSRLLSVASRTLDHVGAISEIDPLATNEVFVGGFFKELNELRSGRGKPATYLDSCAVDHVLRINRERSVPRRPLYLVTRSHFMHVSLQTLIAKGQLDENEYCLRHPRAIVIKAAFENSANKNIGQVRDMLNLLDSLIERNGDRATPRRSETGRRLEKIEQEAIDQLHEVWGNLVAVVLADENARVASFDPEQKKRDQAFVKTIIGLVRDDRAVEDLIAERLAELNAEIKSRSAFLSFVMSAGGLDFRESLSSAFVGVDVGEKISLRAKKHRMPYTLQLFSREAKALDSSQKQDKDVSWMEIAEVLQVAFCTVRDPDKALVTYETMLVAGFLLAAIGKINLGRKFAEAAERFGDDSSVSPHEARFLRAVCVRKGRYSNGTVAECLDLLEKASKEKQLKKEEGYIDPRYWAERGVQILVGQDLDSSQAGDIPGFDMGFHYLEGALPGAKKDKILRGLIANNLLYGTIKYDLKPSSEDIELWLEAIELANAEAGVEDDRWAPAELDTYLLAKVNYRLFSNAQEAKRARSQWIKCLRADELTEEEKCEVRDNIARLDELIERRQFSE